MKHANMKNGKFNEIFHWFRSGFAQFNFNLMSKNFHQFEYPIIFGLGVGLATNWPMRILTL